MKKPPSSTLGDYLRAVKQLQAQDASVVETVAGLFGLSNEIELAKSREPINHHLEDEKDPFQFIPSEANQEPTKPAEVPEDFHYLEPIRVEQPKQSEKDRPGLVIQSSTPLKSAQFISDGRQIITLSDLTIWDVGSGKKVHEIMVGSNQPTCFAIGNDGKYLAYCQEGQIIFYDIANRAEWKRIDAETESIHSITFRNDGRTVIIVCGDGIMKMYNPNREVCIIVEKDPSITLRSVAYHQHGFKTISGTSNGSIYFIRVDVGQLLKDYPAHSGAIDTFSFHPSGEIFATGSSDCKVGIWESVLCRNRKMLMGHEGEVSGVAFHPNGNLLASCSADKTVKIWNAETGDGILTLHPSDTEITSVSWSPDGTRLLASAIDGRIYVWDLANLHPEVEVVDAVSQLAPTLVSLFSPNWERSILKGLASYQSQTGKVDMDQLLQSVATNQPFKRLPLMSQFAMVSSVQLLIDVGDEMMPFTADLDHLEKSMRETTGSDHLQVLRFEGHPDNGAGSGPVINWQPWKLPLPGTHVIIVSNLGVLPTRATYERRRWLRFALRLKAGNCSLVTLVPVSLSKLPSDLKTQLNTIYWDRSTSLQHIKNLLHRQ